MYIINDTYFQSPKREIPNLDEADSKTFVELGRLIDEECRLFMYNFLTVDEVTDFESYLEDGIFPIEAQPNPLLPDYVPQKWIDLVNGTTYTINGVDLVWNGLIYSLGTSKQSLLADYVYSIWLETQSSYMTGVGDAKGNPKGANLVNPTQRIVNVWNEFVKQYQMVWTYSNGYEWFNYSLYPICYIKNSNVSLLQFLHDNLEVYTSSNRTFFEVKNQLGL